MFTDTTVDTTQLYGGGTVTADSIGRRNAAPRK